MALCFLRTKPNIFQTYLRRLDRRCTFSGHSPHTTRATAEVEFSKSSTQPQSTINNKHVLAFVVRFDSYERRILFEIRRQERPKGIGGDCNFGRTEDGAEFHTEKDAILGNATGAAARWDPPFRYSVESGKCAIDSTSSSTKMELITTCPAIDRLSSVRRAMAQDGTAGGQPGSV